MNPLVEEVLKDRLSLLRDNSDTVADDPETIAEWNEEADAIEEALNKGKLNKVSEEVLLEYATRDGWCDDRSYKRQVNTQLQKDGRLELFNPDAVVLGSPMKVCVINGMKYYSAV